MKTTFTESEDMILKEMYEKLSKVFGITLSENYLTLRFSGPNNILQTVSMKIEDVDAGHDTQCYMCGECFNSDDMYEVDVSIGSCVDAHKFKAKLCWDCYCPK